MKELPRQRQLESKKLGQIGMALSCGATPVCNSKSLKFDRFISEFETWATVKSMARLCPVRPMALAVN